MTDYSAIDYADPCATLEAMRPAYYRLVGGESAQSVTFTAGSGTQKMVTFHRTDITQFANLIAKLEQQCQAKSGKRRRFAIRAGGRIL